jgi:Antimicrobial peptide resistance and lipid A acylation protein PagP
MLVVSQSIMDSRFPLARTAWLLVLLCALACLPRPAWAGEWAMILNGKAFHMDKPAGTHYNESNWGFGAQYDFDARDGNWIPFVTTSWFIDSNKNPSYYAGGGIAKRFDFGPAKYELHADIGLVGFVMLREGFRGDMPFIGALPVAALGAGRVAMNVTYIPRTDPKGVPIYFLQIKIGLGKMKKG